MRQWGGGGGGGGGGKIRGLGGGGGGVRQNHLEERKRTKLGGVEETDAPRIVVVVMATVTSDC